MSAFYSTWIKHLVCNFEPMFDFMFPVKVMPLAQPYNSLQAGVQLRDACYPALAMVWEGLFPPTLFGGFLCTMMGLAFYLFGALCVLKRFEVKRTWLWLLVLGFSAPVIFSFYVGNLIFYAAGALNVYFAWYDSESRFRRWIAASMLALAAVLKIVPCLAGLMYLQRWNRRNLALAAFSALTFLVLFFVPFAFCGGMEAIPLWLRNASLNSTAYAYVNGLGVYGLVGELSRIIGYRGEVLSCIGPYARAGSILLALFCLWRGWRSANAKAESMVLLCLGMLFLPPTMMMYVTLYVLPLLIVLASRRTPSLSRTCLWTLAAICLPVRIPLLLGSFNGLFSAAGLIDVSLHLTHHK